MGMLCLIDFSLEDKPNSLLESAKVNAKTLNNKMNTNSETKLQTVNANKPASIKTEAVSANKKVETKEKKPETVNAKKPASIKTRLETANKKIEPKEKKQVNAKNQ